MGTRSFSLFSGAMLAGLVVVVSPAIAQQPHQGKTVGRLLSQEDFRSVRKRTLADAQATGAPRIPAHIALRNFRAEAPLRQSRAAQTSRALVQTTSYSYADLNKLSYPDLVALLATSPQITDIFQDDADARAFYEDTVRLQYLIDALQVRGSSFTADDDQGITPLTEIIRAGYYLASWYSDIAWMYTWSYRNKCLPAIHAVQANPNFGLGTATQDAVVLEMALLVDDASGDPQAINNFAPVLQDFGNQWAAYASVYSKSSAVYYIMQAVDYGLNSVLQGAPYTPQQAGAFAGTIDAYLNQVARLANTFDYDPSGTGWIIDNAVYFVGYDGRFYSTQGFGLAAVTITIQKYGQTPWLYASAQAAEVIHYLYQDVDANGQAQNWAQIQSEIRAQYTPVITDFDCGLFHTHVGAQVDPLIIRKLIWAHKETRAQFFRALGSDVPVDPSHHADDTLTLYIYNSPYDYRMNRFAWGLATNNGGIYIENLGMFFSYDRTPAESYYTLEELFRHEGVHYLQSRYEEPGFFGDSPLYDNNRLTWIDEGSAEFFAGSTRTQGVLPRAIEAQLVASDGSSNWFTISDVIHAGYGSFVFYHYADAFVGYLYHNHWDNYVSMLDRLMADDGSGFSAIAAQDAGDPSMNTGYHDFLQYLKDNASSFPTPATSYDYLTTPQAKPPAEVYAEIQAATGLTNLSSTTTTGCTAWDTYTLRGTYVAGPTKGSFLADWQDLDAKANGWLDALANSSWSGYKTDTAYFTNYQTDGSGQVTWQLVFHGLMNDGSRVASPLITSFVPVRGRPGDSVVITGAAFTSATAVLFNGVPASSFTVDSDTQITAVAPGEIGSGPISVATSAGGTGYSSTNFKIIGISNFSPQSSYRNGVIVNGAGFTGATDVLFNGVSTSWFVAGNDTNIFAYVPLHATTGPLEVITPDGILTSSMNFVVLGTFAFAPAHGYPGATVTLTGKGYTSALGAVFGNVTAETFSVDSDTQITTVIPQGIHSGSIEVDVNTSGMTYFAPGPFVIDNLASLTVSPSSLVGGQSATGTITLSTPALASGATISLQSNNAAVQVPSSIIIPAGSTSAQFAITTSLVTSQVTANVSSPLDGTSAQLFLNPMGPTVSLTAPANGSTVSGMTTVSANASDNVGVAGVQFRLDGSNLGAEVTSAPYSANWNTTTAANGGHTLTAVARDAAGNSTTSAAVAVTVNNADSTPPTVSLTAPANGSTVSGTTTVSANASDNVGVAGVQFKLDGVNLGSELTNPPYSLSWDATLATNTSHNLTATARDAAGKIAVASVTVTVNNSTDFAISVSPNSASAVTTPAGGNAVFALNLGPTTGFTGPVTFACAGAPSASACVVNPNPAQVSGHDLTSITVNITTTARDSTSTQKGQDPLGRLPFLWVATLLSGLALVRTGALRRKTLRTLMIGAASVALLVMSGCGGGSYTTSTLPPNPSPTGTPAGTYTITVTGTAGAVTHSISLQLTVN